MEKGKMNWKLYELGASLAIVAVCIILPCISKWDGVKGLIQCLATSVIGTLIFDSIIIKFEIPLVDREQYLKQYPISILFATIEAFTGLVLCSLFCRDIVKIVGFGIVTILGMIVIVAYHQIAKKAVARVGENNEE